MLVEVCVNSLQSARNAAIAGADRVELCAELAVGGITPSHGLLKKVREELKIAVHVLVRPRSGDFTYSDSEFEVMLADIAFCRQMGVQGVVSGVLLKDNQIDLERTRALIVASKGMSFTFHRAFDWLPDPELGLRQLEDLGVQTVLTSGQQPKAVQGLALLKELNRQASSCMVMPGSGISASNVLEFKQAGFKAVHLSGIAAEEERVAQPPISMNSPGLLSDQVRYTTLKSNVEGVVRMVK